MEDLVIDLRNLGGTESEIGSPQEDEGECAWVRMSGICKWKGIRELSAHWQREFELALLL